MVLASVVSGQGTQAYSLQPVSALTHSASPHQAPLLPLKVETRDLYLDRACVCVRARVRVLSV